MPNMNRVTLIGHVGRDPDVRYTQSGGTILSFSLATSEKWTGRDGEKKEETQWHRVDVFGKLADALKDYITKGKALMVEGKLVYEDWTDKDGNKKTTAKIKLSGYGSNIILLGGKGESATVRSSAKEQEPVSESDDIPF